MRLRLLYISIALAVVNGLPRGHPVAIVPGSVPSYLLAAALTLDLTHHLA